MKTKRIFSILLALCLAVGIISATGVSVHAAVPEITIKIFAQVDDTGFLLAPQSLTVRADLSEAYGYDDDFGGEQVSMLDVLVAAHVKVFGTAGVTGNFTFSGGYTTKMLGVSTMNCGYFLNGAAAFDTADTVTIAGGDTVSIYVYQDSMGMDIGAWFEAGGRKVETLTVGIGDSVEFTMRGLVAAGYGDWAGPTRLLDGVAIVPVTLSGAGAVFGASLAVTGGNGKATVSFNTAGEFILSAIDVDSDQELPLLSPWLVVKVKSLAELLADAKAGKIAAINAVTAGLKEEDYTAGSWAALQAAIIKAIADVNAAATVAAVNAVAVPSKGILAIPEPTTLEKWEAKLPGWLSWISSLPTMLEWAVMIVLFGWIWWLF